MLFRRSVRRIGFAGWEPAVRPYLLNLGTASKYARLNVLERLYCLNARPHRATAFRAREGIYAERCLRKEQSLRPTECLTRRELLSDGIEMFAVSRLQQGF